MPPEAQQIIDMVFQQVGTLTGAIPEASLANRLQQLEEAREQDLITGEEYHRARDAILDAFDD